MRRCDLLRLDDRAIREIATNGGLTTPETTADLLDKVESFVRRYVVLTDAQATTVALWAAHTHALDAFNCTPYLSVTSADKQSGKTRLLEVLDLLVAKPWFTGRATAAVLVRKIDKEQPTLLLDESDAAFRGEKEYAETLRGLLNTGFKRNGRYSMCVGQGAEISYKDFSTFCPKAIAGIGKLPDTVADRSIPVRLQRRAPEEGSEVPRAPRARGGGTFYQALVAFARRRSTPSITSAQPAEQLSDRAEEVWEPLRAMAGYVGGEWPARVRTPRSNCQPGVPLKMARPASGCSAISRSCSSAFAMISRRA